MSKNNRRLKISFNSPVVLTFAILMFVATLLGMASNYSITRALFSTSRSGLLNIMTYVRLFTHVIGHWSFQHFISNVSVLLLLGPMLEEKYGGGVLVEVILITAFITGVINNVLFPFSCLAGASGVVFAFIILASFTEFKKGEIPLTFILVALFYIGNQIWDGVTLRDNISNLSHIIGGLCGAWSGYMLNMKTGK